MNAQVTNINRTLEKLEWPLLLAGLSGHCHTEEGKERCLALWPNKDRTEIEDRWRAVEPLRRLAGQSYRAPIGNLAPISQELRAAKLGQILGGLDLRAVFNVLESTRKVHGFAVDFETKCTSLRRFKANLHPMPALLGAINKAVTPDGELRDDASEELTRIRRQKLAARKRIEESITKLLHDSELTPYLQDDFFTVRSERYVVPMRLDGRGRVKGSILDTSASGQTLFIEPSQISPLNDQLQEIDLEEKLEIARIFRELTAKVGAEAEILAINYELLIDLDVMTAEAQLAAESDAGAVELSDTPTLDLKDARHPMLKRSGGKSPVGNTIGLDAAKGQVVLIISGPNAGGKTVVLKTVGLLHLMAKAGLLVPADPRSRIYPFARVFVEMGDAQNLAANLSTFSGHLNGLKPILEQANAEDLVLLDELAVGTDPQTGAAIGTAILEDLAQKRTSSLVTTHFDALKSLAISDDRFRNGSMEFSMKSLLPTYKLILDVPGQSYGLEVAEHMGLPARILTRAKELRHGTMSSLDKAVTQLMQARDETRVLQDDLAKEKLEAETQRLRWEQECDLLRETRRKASQQLVDKYEAQMSDMRTAFDEVVRKMRQAAREAEKGGDANRPLDEKLGDRRAGEALLRNMDNVVGELAKGYDVGDKLPGQVATPKDLTPGTPVYVLPLKKAGKVLKSSGGADEPVEVEVGIIKLRVSLHDLRVLSAGEAAGGQGSGKKNAPKSGPGGGKAFTFGGVKAGAGKPGGREGTVDTIGLTIQTPTNSLDLRGKDADQALDATWNFIDRALLRGEEFVIIIHGHGTDTLKNAVRDALRNNCPYEVSFRPGQEQEGGDGVTVVKLRL